MPSIITVRSAVPEDTAAISSLILEQSQVFLNGADPAESADFLATLSPAALRDLYADPAIEAWVALDGDDIVGVGSMKDHRHLYHLFVQPQQQGRGIARQLWTQLRSRALAHGNGGVFTVNSSLNAVPVYQRLGFVPTVAPQARHGIRYQPMQLPEQTP